MTKQQTKLVERKTRFSVIVKNDIKQAEKDLYRMVKTAQLIATL